MCLSSLNLQNPSGMTNVIHMYLTEEPSIRERKKLAQSSERLNDCTLNSLLPDSKAGALLLRSSAFDLGFQSKKQKLNKNL